MTELFDLFEQLDRTGIMPASKRGQSASRKDCHRTQELGQLARCTRVEAAIGAARQGRDVAGGLEPFDQLGGRGRTGWRAPGAFIKTAGVEQLGVEDPPVVLDPGAG